MKTVFNFSTDMAQIRFSPEPLVARHYITHVYCHKRMEVTILHDFPRRPSITGRFAFLWASCLILILLLFMTPSTRAEDSTPSVAAIDSALAGRAPLDGHVVYVDFWASWCMPCRHSFPWMEQLANRLAHDGLQVVTVNLDKDHNAALKFLKELNSSLTVVYDSTGDLAKRFNVEAMPSSFIFDRSGKLRDTHLGFDPNDTAAIEESLIKLLEEEKPE